MRLLENTCNDDDTNPKGQSFEKWMMNFHECRVIVIPANAAFPETTLFKVLDLEKGVINKVKIQKLFKIEKLSEKAKVHSLNVKKE